MEITRAKKERGSFLIVPPSLSLRTGELRPRLCCEMFKSSAHLSLSLSPAPRFWSDRLQVYCEHCSSWALGSRLQLVGPWADRVWATQRAELPSSVRHNIDTHHQTAITPCLISGPGIRLRSLRQCSDHTPGAALLTVQTSPGLCSVIVRPARRTGLDSLTASPGPGLRCNQVFMERQDV